MIEEVSSSLLGEFAARLERELAGEATAPVDGDQTLDVGNVAGAALRRRLVPLALDGAVLVISTAGAYQLGRRR
jgi:hypothetical protein